MKIVWLIRHNLSHTPLYFVEIHKDIDKYPQGSWTFVFQDARYYGSIDDALFEIKVFGLINCKPEQHEILDDNY